MVFIHFILISTVLADQTEKQIWEDLFNSNGWIPITREEVYNSLDRKLAPIINDRRTYERDSNDFVVNQRIFNNNENARKFLPRHHNYYIHFNSSLISSSQIPDILERDDFKNNEGANIDNDIVLNTRKHRKAKLVSSEDTTNEINIYTQTEKIITQRDVNDNDKQEILDYENQYLVTESEKQKEVLQKLNSGYTKPLINAPSMYSYHVINGTAKDNAESYSNGFTNKLLGILSSYNIRVNDVLPNYELSRHASHHPMTQEYFFVPIPITLSSRYNNLNHLPVDPLLAVFLSNYGYYIPGQYGFNNKYHNLYGHLASNNIHNNKPFGSYKIFADTDSSN